LEADFFLGVGLIFATAAVAGALALKAKLSPIVGFIAVGALIGPSGLNLITKGPLLDLFAEIGIILLLFIVGVEFEVEKLSRLGPAIITIGLLQTSIAFLLGYLAGAAMGWTTLSSMYLGGALMFSSTAIIVKMLKDMGLGGSSEYETSVGVLVLQDAMAVMLLIILLNATTSGGASLDVVAVTLTKTITFIVLSIALGVKAIPFVLDKVAKMKMTEAPLLTALSLAFLVAFLAGELGVSKAVGAFTAGLTIAYSPNAKLVRDVVSPLKDFFMTIFFVSIGTLIYIDLQEAVQAALLAVPLILIILASRVIGCSMGGLMGGLSEESSLGVAAMLIPIGEFSFIIAKQGVELGVLPETVFPSLALMCVATTIISPPLINRMPSTFAKMLERQPAPLKAMSTFLRRGLGGSFKNILQSHVHLTKFKNRVKGMLFNVFLMFIALSLLSMLRPYVLLLYENIPQLHLLGKETFTLLIALAIIAYPLADLLMDTDKVAGMLMTQTLTRFPRLRAESGRVRRVTRNLSFAVVLLGVSIILAPGISGVSDLPYISILTTLLITATVLILVFDATYIFHRGLWKAMKEALRPHSETYTNGHQEA